MVHPQNEILTDIPKNDNENTLSVLVQMITRTGNENNLLSHHL